MRPPPPPRIRGPDGHLKAPTWAMIDALADRIDLPHQSARAVVIASLEVMIAADLGREIRDLAARSGLSHDKIILTIYALLEPPAAPPIEASSDQNSGP